MLEILSTKITQYDSYLTGNIYKFLDKYYPAGNPPFFSALLPNFIKVVLYLLPFLILFSILKFLYPYNQKLTFILIIILAFIALSIGGIFIGFFQLAFTF